MTFDGSRRLFAFEPVDGSAEKRYTFVLRAIGNDAAATILVLGSLGDPYPDGQALFPGRTIEGDASFRYGCTRSPTSTRATAPAE